MTDIAYTHWPAHAHSLFNSANTCDGLIQGWTTPSMGDPWNSHASKMITSPLGSFNPKERESLDRWGGYTNIGSSSGQIILQSSENEGTASKYTPKGTAFTEYEPEETVPPGSQKSKTGWEEAKSALGWASRIALGGVASVLLAHTVIADRMRLYRESRERRTTPGTPEAPKRNYEVPKPPPELSEAEKFWAKHYADSKAARAAVAAYWDKEKESTSPGNTNSSYLEVHKSLTREKSRPLRPYMTKYLPPDKSVSDDC